SPRFLAQVPNAPEPTSQTAIPTPIDATEPQHAIVLAWPLRWWSSHWTAMQNTKAVALDDSQGHPVFRILEPHRSHVWVRYFDLPVPFPEYAILSITCRATGMAPSTSYLVWVDDGAGPDFGGLTAIRINDLKNDGVFERHTVDLRKLKGHRQDLRGIAIGMASGDGPAEFELFDLRFLTPDDLPALPRPQLDQPVEVKVVDAGNQPIPGAEVIVDAERANWAKSAPTNADGVALLMPWRTSSTRHMIRVAAPGFAAVEVRDIQLGQQLRVTLPRAVTWRGLVRDPQGSPAPHATVAIFHPREHGDTIWTRFDTEVLTDEQGRWQSPPMPWSDKPMRFCLAHPDYSQGPAYNRQMERSCSQADQPQQFDLDQVANLQGIVLDPDGKPVQSVRVLVGRGRIVDIPSTLTDAQGQFSLRVPVSVPSRLTILPAGFAPTTVDLDAPISNQPLSISLKHGNTICGRVVDHNGQPISGAEVSACSWRDNRTLSYTAKTTVSGEFRWNFAPDDEVIFTIEKDGFGVVQRQPMTPREEPYVITLPPPDIQTEPYDSSRIFRKIS
ncbi:MAG: carboxypeptidase regulatory-like domain-containing protein, partial [Phycisphaeraceae bacterium]|nr:carboxypeptidase regulatory-like domain-containing protein [Phycisphaeraceae bacterium]